MFPSPRPSVPISLDHLQMYTRLLSSSRSLFQQSARVIRRCQSSNSGPKAKKWTNKHIGMAIGAIGVGGLTLSYAAVPMYQAFCRATGYFGAVGNTGVREVEETEEDRKIALRPITVRFNSDVASGIPWSFAPSQKEITVIPGESALAFYTATNNSEKPIIGVSTYNVTPAGVATYFNKIQCFCFEHQRLSPHETVELPVFFYLDRDMMKDDALHDCHSVILTYTFFLTEDEDEAEQMLQVAQGAESTEIVKRPGAVVAEVA